MESSNLQIDAVSTTAEGNVLNKSLPKSSKNIGDSNISEHPLLNPLIVDQIVKHLDPDFEQLKILRLVSKVWTQTTHHHWRTSSGVVTLVPDPPNFSKSKYERGISISSFLKEFNDPQSPFQLHEKPFTKYKLQDFTLDLEVCSEPDSPAFKFWNAIGPLMDSLHLYKCVFNKSARISNAVCPRVLFLIRKIQNLRHLVLTDITTLDEETLWNTDEITINDIEATKLKAFEKGQHLQLRTLTVHGDLRKDMSLIPLLMFAPELNVIMAKNQFATSLLMRLDIARYRSSKCIPQPLSNLKHLELIHSKYLWDMMFPFDSNYAPYIFKQVKRGSQIPLEKLSLHLEPINIGTENFDVYIKSFSSTLTSFTGLRAPAGLPFSKFLSDGSMIALTELYLMGTFAAHMGFLKSTPNLKKLKIDLGCFEKWDMLKNVINTHNMLNNGHSEYEKYKDDMVAKVPSDLRKEIFCIQLEYFESDFEFKEESLRLLGKWMPNLKILKTILNVGTVPVVCEIWKKLNELVCLHGSEIEDSCFIRLAQKQEAASSRLSPQKLKICDLEELERFQFDAYCDDCELTDDVVFNGFLKMPGLISVKLCVNFRMSVKAEDALRKGIQFCQVVRDVRNCGISALFGISSVLCDRCKFRRRVIWGLSGLNDNDYVENEGDIYQMTLRRRVGSHFKDISDQDGNSSSSDN